MADQRADQLTALTAADFDQQNDLLVVHDTGASQLKKMTPEQALIGLLGVYNVVTYGADPTGASDSRAAIQSAIDAANTAGGGTVVLPFGTYIVNDSGSNHPVRGANYGYALRMQSNVRLWLLGATIKLADEQITGSDPDVSGPVDVIVAVDETNWQIVGPGTIDGNAAGQSGWSGGYTQTTGSVGVRSYGTSEGGSADILLADLTIQNCFSNAADFRNDTGTQYGHHDCLFRDIKVTGCGEGLQYVFTLRGWMDGISIESPHTTVAAAQNSSSAWVGDATEWSTCKDARLSNLSVNGVVGGSCFDFFSTKGFHVNGCVLDTINRVFGNETSSSTSLSVERCTLSNMVIRNCIAGTAFPWNSSATENSDSRGGAIVSNIYIDGCVVPFDVQGSNDIVSAVAGHPGYRDVVISNFIAVNATGSARARDLSDRRLVLNNVSIKTKGGTDATFTVTTGTDKVNITSHGLSNNATVMFSSSAAEGLPDPLLPETVYYVRSAGANDFEVSTERDGASIDITTSGSGTLTAHTGFPASAMIIDQSGDREYARVEFSNCIFDNAGGTNGMIINDASQGTLRVVGKMFGVTLVNDLNASADTFSCSASVNMSECRCFGNKPAAQIKGSGFNVSDIGFHDELHLTGLSNNNVRQVTQGSEGQKLLVKIVPIDLTDERDYQWTASGSGTNEYYLEAAGGGDPGIHSSVTPTDVLEDGSVIPEGTAGSLTAGQWDFADNDTLGYSTVYVRLTDGADPDSKARGFVKAYYGQRIYDDSDATGTGIRLLQTTDDGAAPGAPDATQFDMEWPDTLLLAWDPDIEHMVEVSRSENNR